MTNPILLDNVEHHDLRVVTRFDARFGDGINQVLIFPTEFEEMQREYPIFFRKDEHGAYQPVAILGLDREENLFLDNGEWRAHYIPALQQRLGFLAGFTADGAPGAFFDPSHPRFSYGEGEALFRSFGGNTPLLERIMRALRLIHTGRPVIAPMFAAFEAAGLIRPIEIELKLDENTQYILSDFHTINEEALAQLDGPVLKTLNEAGFLAYACYVSSSKRNLSRLLEMKGRKRG